MRRFAAFILSFLSALLLLSATAFGIFKLSRPKAEEKSSAEGENKMPDAEIPLIAVYDDGVEVYAALLTLHVADGKCDAKPICNIEGEPLREYLENNGFYPFVEAVKNTSGVPDAHFLKFNENSFIKVADRSNNLVYNEGASGERLLTGSQARSMLCDDSFAYLCRQIAEGSMDDALLSELLYFANTVENDLSYPELYDLICK